MRILQIIDTLETGGAEKMAVSYANALSECIEFSALVATRAEGPLLSQLKNTVSYLFLQKRSAFDVMAVIRLRSFVKKHAIGIVHAHSTSFFTAVLLKLVCPQLKLVWHDHYGEALSKRSSTLLRVCIPFFFSGVIAVNRELLEWSTRVLRVENALYLPNFAVADGCSPQTHLKGSHGCRILCIANLRPQKNHMLLLETAAMALQKYPYWSLHLIGKDFADEHSAKVLQAIDTFILPDKVYYYGTAPDISHIIRQADIGILSSASEGLPVALLEFGSHGLPVVMPAVGEIPAIVVDGENGRLFQPGDKESLLEAIVTLMADEDKRKMYGKNLQRLIDNTYAVQPVIESYVNWLKRSNV